MSKVNATTIAEAAVRVATRKVEEAIEHRERDDQYAADLREADLLDDASIMYAMEVFDLMPRFTEAIAKLMSQSDAPAEAVEQARGLITLVSAFAGAHTLDFASFIKESTDAVE